METVSCYANISLMVVLVVMETSDTFYSESLFSSALTSKCAGAHTRKHTCTRTHTDLENSLFFFPYFLFIFFTFLVLFKMWKCFVTLGSVDW